MAISKTIIFKNKHGHKAPIENSSISLENLKYFNEHYARILEEVKQILYEFPTLKFMMYPYKKFKQPFIHGWLFDQDYADQVGLDPLHYENNSIYIYAEIQQGCLENGLLIKDYYKMIDVNAIPKRHQHIHESGYICSSLEAEISERKHPMFDDLKSTYILVLAYKELERTGLFHIDEYSHKLSNANKQYYKKRMKK